MKKKIKRLKGFYMNRKSGHPSYVFSQKDKNTKSLGFTHNKNDKAPKEELTHNIDPNGKGKSFVKIKVENQKVRDFRNIPEYKDYRIHREDLPIIVKIIENDKKKSKH